jgi:hypothetical protein
MSGILSGWKKRMKLLMNNPKYVQIHTVHQGARQ